MMSQRLRHLFLMLAMAWSFILLPFHAYAAGGDLNCTPQGTVALRDDGTRTALFSDGTGSGGACYLTGVDHVFSQVICSFVTVLNDVLGKIYCSMQVAIVDLLKIVLTIYVMIFGVQLLMGLTQLNSREIMTRLLKIGGVWMFATQATWMIGYVFNFFIDLGSSGIYWALGSIPISSSAFGTLPAVAANAPATPSTCIAQLYQTADWQQLHSVMPVYAFMDQLLYCSILAPLSTASLGVIGFFLAMIIVVPPITMLLLYWLWSILSVLARGLISFLMGISALAFLITLSPIFLSLMLFKATYQFFENWLKYMISYSLQIIIVFACIAMWATTIPMIVSFFTELSNIIFSANKVTGTTQVSDISGGWGICPYAFDPNSVVPRIRCDDPNFNPIVEPFQNNTDSSSATYVPQLDPGSPLYTPEADPNNPAYNPEAPIFNPSDFASYNPAVAAAIDAYNDTTADRQSDKKKLILLSKLAGSKNDPQAAAGAPTCTPSGCNREGGLHALGDLIYYVIYHLITLIIITYAFDALLKSAPQIATALAGPEYMFTVGQGFGASGFGTTGRGSTQRLKAARQGMNQPSMLDTVRNLSSRNPVAQFNEGAANMATTSRNRSIP